MRYLLAIICLCLAGCKTNSSGWPVIPFMHNWNSHRASLVAPPATGKTIYVKFDAPREYDGFNLYGGTNLNRSDWRLLVSTNATAIPVQTAVPSHGLFGVKAFLRNGIDGAMTESQWGLTP